jgi:hypothetical protein
MPITQLGRLQAWTQSLPYANPTTVITSLSSEVGRLRGATLKPAQLLKLLEVHARAYDRLAEALARRAGSREQRRADSGGARVLAMRLAAGYGRVVSELSGTPRGFLSGDKALATAAQRHSVFVTHTLLHGYDEYAVSDPRQWSTLSQLYHLAAARGFADRAGTADWARAEFGAPIAHVYKRALLTGLVDPHRLGRTEIWRVYDLLGEHADKAILTRRDQVQDAGSVFLVDAGDARRGVSLSQAGDGPGEAEVLDAGPVTQALRADLVADGAARPASAVEARTRRQHVSLVKRLLAMLDAPRHRGPARQAGETKVHLAVGLGAIHEAMGARGARRGRARFDLPGGNGGPRPSGKGKKGSADEDEDLAPDSIDMIDPHSGATIAVASERKPKNKGAGDDADVEAPEVFDPAFGIDQWKVADRGPHGIGIARKGRPRAAVGVGEPVAFRSGRGSWVVGVVRWLAVDSGDVHRAGIEVLSPVAAPVEVLAVDEGRDGAVHAALLLRSRDGGPSAAMIALPGTRVPGRMLCLRDGNGRTTGGLRVGKLIETTPVCEIFAVREVAPE